MQNLVVDISQRVCTGHHAGGESASHQATEAAAPFRRGRGAPVQADGLLLQGGTLLRREGGHDLLRQAQDLGA